MIIEVISQKVDDYVFYSINLQWFICQDMEKNLIVKALEKYNGKRKYAAKELGISERTLYRKIKEFDL